MTSLEFCKKQFLGLISVYAQAPRIVMAKGLREAHLPHIRFAMA